MAMNSEPRNCDMEIHRARGPAARKWAKPSTFVLAAATVALGGCRLPRDHGFIPEAPIAVESAPRAALPEDVEQVLQEMETAYDEVKDYQAEVEVILFPKAGSMKSERSLYTFKKPKWIRLDFLSPHPDMIVIYPDPNGKVIVKPQGLLSGITLHLKLDDPFLQTPSGQRINQTDIGLLIRNIRHSVTDQRRGPVSLSEDKDTIQIEVLADDHFRERLETRYRFLISKEFRLPVEVGASTLSRVPEGRIIFRNLRTNINVPDDLFQ